MEVGVFRSNIFLALVGLCLVVGCSRSSGIDASAPDASVKGFAMADAAPVPPRATSLFGDAGRRFGAAFGAVGGDLAGYMPEPTIAKIDGINLPAPSGTSTVLTYGGGALSWALPPAAGDGGADVVWANDLVGSTNSAQYIAAISGQGGSTPNVPVSATSFTWGTTGTFIGNTTVKGTLFEQTSGGTAIWALEEQPSSTQSALYSGNNIASPSSTNFSLRCAQNGSTCAINGGSFANLDIAGVAVVNAGTFGVDVSDGSNNNLWTLTELPSSTTPAIYAGNASLSSATAYTLASNSSMTSLNAPGSSAFLELEVNGNPIEEILSSGIVRIQDTSSNLLFQVTEVPSTTNGAIYPGGLTPSSSNYALACNSSETLLNSGGVTGMGSLGTSILAVGQAGLSFTPTTVTLNGTTQDLTVASGSGQDLFGTFVLKGSLGGTNVLVLENLPGEWSVDVSSFVGTSGLLAFHSGSGAATVLHSVSAGAGGVTLLKIRTNGSNGISYSYSN